MDIINGVRVVDKSNTTNETYRVEVWQKGTTDDPKVLENYKYLEEIYLAKMKEKASNRGPVISLRPLK